MPNAFFINSSLETTLQLCAAVHCIKSTKQLISKILCGYNTDYYHQKKIWPETKNQHKRINTSMSRGWISLLLPRSPKLPRPFEQHWLGNLSNLGSHKEVHHKIIQFIFCTWKDNIITSIHNKIPYMQEITLYLRLDNVTNRNDFALIPLNEPYNRACQ